MVMENLACPAPLPPSVERLPPQVINSYTQKDINLYYDQLTLARYGFSASSIFALAHFSDLCLCIFYPD